MWKYNIYHTMCELLKVGDKIHIDISNSPEKYHNYRGVEVAHIYHTDWTWDKRPCDTSISVSTTPSIGSTIGYHPARIKEVECILCPKCRRSYVEV